MAPLCQYRNSSRLLWIARCTYLDQNHGRDLLGGELLGLTEVLNLDLGVAVVINDLEGPGLLVLLDGGVIVATTDQSPECDDKSVHEMSSCGGGGTKRSVLDVEDGVDGVHGGLVLGSLTD